MIKQMTKLIFIALLVLPFINGQNNSIIFDKNSSIIGALKFVNTPADKIERSAKSVRGTLITGEFKKFADMIIDIRENNSPGKFESLMSEKSKKNKRNSEFAKGIIESINGGEFLYKGEANRFFVTSEKVTDEEYKNMSNDYMYMLERPDTKIPFQQ